MEEIITVNPPERPERPKTSRGHRRRQMPSRPQSRHSRRDTNDEESYGRPVSRVGFSPERENEYSYSHDEFSRQQAGSDDLEKQIQNSPSESPEILYRDDEYFNNQKALCTPSPRQEPATTDRLIVSPSGPQDLLGGRNSQKSRKSPQGANRKSPYGYGQSPHSHNQSPSGYRQSPQARPSSREYINVSPLLRDEPQLQSRDVHDGPGSSQYSTESPYTNEGDSYQQRFTDNSYSQYRNSPYQDNASQYRDSSYRNSPYQDPAQQFRDSPGQTRDSPYYGSSPGSRGGHHNTGSYGHQSHNTGSPEMHNRPPPAPRPKSARPKTGNRRKSARVRQTHARYQDQQTSPPQQCDTDSILNAGDPYGRPSSSLSPYKPLPAIGTPRDGEPSGMGQEMVHGSHGGRRISDGENVTVKTQKLSLNDGEPLYSACSDTDIFSAEDIQNADDQNLKLYTGHGVPNIDMLTDTTQNLTDEIYQTSVLNFERNVEGGHEEGENEEGVNIPRRDDGRFDHEAENERPDSGVNLSGNSPENLLPSPIVPKNLETLHDLSEEPGPNEPRILLAVKLPDGRRIQRYFSPDDSLRSVMHYAENESLLNYEDFSLMCNAPRASFTDLDWRIGDSQIKDRTVLYLEAVDE